MRKVAGRAPVSGELLPDGGDDELLHLLVRLGDQVHRRALLHDADVTVQGLADHLGANIPASSTQRERKRGGGSLF